MNKLKVDLEYCHGINKLYYEFDFTIGNYILYAQNGTMKTSFYKTFEDYINDIESKDIFFPERVNKRIIIDENNNKIDADKIVLIGNEDYKIENSKITSLLVNSKLKKEYDEIFNILDKKDEKIKKIIKSKTGEKIDSLYRDLNINNLTETKEWCYNENNLVDFKNIKYNEIFSEDNIKILSQKIVVDSIQEYIKICDKIIEEKGIFIKNAFEFYHLKNIVKTLESNNFFMPGHLIKLKTSRLEEKYMEYDNQKLNKLIEDISVSIETNPNVAAVNLSLTNKISSQKLNSFLSDNQWIIPWLNDLNKLKKEYWRYIINSDSELKTHLKDYIDSYDLHSEKIKMIIDESNKKENLEKWNKAIDEFNRKFINMPFRLEIGNLSDVVLKNSSCSLIYKFSDKMETNENVSEQDLKDNLSKGERNAFKILNLIFEIQYRMEKNIESIIVIDDIADSFDYRNKYAIIEFLKELSDNKLFNIIILTHNFDFYRTCSNRLSLNRLSVIKSDVLSIIDFRYTNNIFKYFKDHINDEKFFIASIPFVRNIVELSKSEADENYLELTKLLHYKQETSQITTKSIKSIVSQVINKDIKINDEKYLDLLFKISDIFKSGNTKIELENKIVLSIAIRIKFEMCLFEKIKDWNIIEDNKSNQTKFMIDYCIEHNLLNSAEIEIAEKVRIMTSDNIHVNAFMYEPIIDMSDDELIDLYVKIKEL